MTHASSYLLIILCLTQTAVFGQAGLRESLERLDKNNNGLIEPDELTPLSRPYLERIAEARRMSLDRPNAIDKFQEAARLHYALQNGVAGQRVRPETETTIRPFGTDPDEPLIPEFGIPTVKYPYTQDDLEEADETIGRYDRNDDGTIDVREAQRVKWTHRNPFDDDLDGDNRLNRLEMAQRYARRRLLKGQSGELVQRAKRVGTGVEPSVKDKDRKSDSRWWREGGSDFWLTSSIMGRFDANKNGRLERDESEAMGLPAGRIDADRDATVTRSELLAYVGRLQKEAGAKQSGVPGWFSERDLDEDGQVSMAEFTVEWTGEKLEEFESLDRNGDGLLAIDEVSSARSAVGGSYSNRTATMIAPESSAISEIEIDDDYLIADINVQISVTHSNLAYLDGYLIGPDGTRVELFTGVGGRDNNFDETIFDDEARTPITKARPPFEGSFIPEGVLKRQPGLSAFKDKPVKGVWQFVIHGLRNDRFGMLHTWNLDITPL